MARDARNETHYRVSAGIPLAGAMDRSPDLIRARLKRQDDDTPEEEEELKQEEDGPSSSSSWNGHVSYTGVFQMEDIQTSDNSDKDDETDSGLTKSKCPASAVGEDGLQDSCGDRETGKKRRSASSGSKKSHGMGTCEDKDRSTAEALFQAIADKDVDVVKEIILSSKELVNNTDFKNAQGHTFLLAVASSRNLEMLETFLSSGADVHSKGARGTTALHMACLNGDFDSVQTLLSAGSDVNSAQDDGSTPLHNACQHGDASKIVHLLITNGAQVRSTRTKDRISGYTALHLAAEVGDASTVEKLIENWPEAVDSKLSDFSTPLHVACRHGYIEVTRTLLDRGRHLVDAVARDVKGSNVTPLHVAVENNHLFVTQALLGSGAEVNAGRVYSNRSGVTSLHLAALKRNADMVKLLLDSGARPNDQDSDNATPMHVAARFGNLGIVQLLVKHGADVNLGMSSRQSVNQTALHLAVRFRHYDVTKLLIRAGCNVNLSEKMPVTNSRGNTAETGTSVTIPASESGPTDFVDAYTPLHWAVENGDLEMVCLLLDNDPQLNTPAAFEEHTGLTPLHLACQDGYSRIAQELLRCPECDRNPKKRTLNRENITPLHQAAYNGHVDTVNVLLENGCDVNIQADNGYSALHYATQQGNVDMTKIILRHGGDVNLLASAKDQTNITALHMAVQSGNEHVVRALVGSGANINSEKTMGDIQGVTPLHQAVYQEKCDIVEVLLELGASVNASMCGWYTALHVASEKGRTEIVTLLLQHSANLNARASHKEHVGITPLHVASQQGRTEVVKQLIDAGASLLVTREFADRSGISPLHLAVESGYEDTASILLEKGIDKNAQDSLKFTPLHVAVQYAFPNIVRLLLTSGCNTKLKTISGLTPAKMAEQMGNAAIQQLFKEAKRKSASFSFRQQPTHSNHVMIEPRTKNKTTTSGLMRLFCGLSKES